MATKELVKRPDDTPARTRENQDRLTALETTVQHELDTLAQSYITLGKTLWEIRKSRLYKLRHSTWEAYCEEHWHLSKAYANRQIEAADVAQRLAPIGAIPQNELQARLIKDRVATIIKRTERGESGEDAIRAEVAIARKRGAKVRATTAKPADPQANGVARMLVRSERRDALTGNELLTVTVAEVKLELATILEANPSPKLVQHIEEELRGLVAILDGQPKRL
jgi:hypothetical protein